MPSWVAALAGSPEQICGRSVRFRLASDLAVGRATSFEVGTETRVVTIARVPKRLIGRTIIRGRGPTPGRRGAASGLGDLVTDGMSHHAAKRFLLSLRPQQWPATNSAQDPLTEPQTEIGQPFP